MILRCAFHLLMVANYAGILYFKAGVKYPLALRSFGGPWKFLTHWNLWFQLVYFSIAVLNNFMGSEATVKGRSSKMQKWRDFLFASVAFPFGVFVSAAFWLIYAYNSELIWPQFLQAIFPPIANHMMHTVPAAGQVIECLLNYHIFPKRFAGLATCGSIALVYLIWICIIAYYGGFWVYPVLGVMSAPGRTVFITICAAMAALLYILGEIANSLVWYMWSKFVFAESRGKKSMAEAEEQLIQQHYTTRSKTRIQKVE